MPIHGLKVTLAETLEPVPPGLAVPGGPYLLPHQSSVATTAYDVPVSTLVTPAVVLPERSSSWAVTMLVSLESKPTDMPVLLPVIESLLTTALAPLPLLATAMPSPLVLPVIESPTIMAVLGPDTMTPALLLPVMRLPSPVLVPPIVASP